jgi:uncharacterized protein YndB with AHSA1/START domain
MHAANGSDGVPAANPTTIERRSDTDVVVTRLIKGPPHLVFSAFTRAELFQRWWVPKSMGMKLVSCEMDVRVGGTYTLAFDVGAPQPLAFFGTYLEVEAPVRLSWTNEEGGEEGGSVTTVTFVARDGGTLVTLTERYASKQALDAAGTGAAEALIETFGQLDALLAEGMAS